jgi:hypothetical protein
MTFGGSDRPIAAMAAHALAAFAHRLVRSPTCTKRGTPE